MPKYIFFTGGVVSGLGKGITAASLGALMKARGLSVDVVRFNPYFNIDSSNLSPQLHGEVYVTEDGKSCDLVIGHYERILNKNLKSENDVTSGEIYSLIISKERDNAYGGATVQVVPHITDEIKKCVLKIGEKGSDIVIVEVGGTVGDIEAHPYLEAIRQLRNDLGKFNTAYVHVSLINYIEVSGEQKTKPTQHSVKELQNLGIQPDVIVCRSDYPLEQGSKNKLSLFCNVEKDCIIENLVTDSIYEIPLKLEDEGFCKVLLRHLRIEQKNEPDLSQWIQLDKKIKAMKESEKTLKVGVVGKFASRINAHVSLRQALLLGGADLATKIDFVEVCGANPESDTIKTLDGLIITEGIVENTSKSILEYAKKNKIPLLMIDKACLLATNCTVKENETFTQGSYATNFVKGTILHDIYRDSVKMRHFRKFSIKREQLDDEYVVSGYSPDGSVDTFELKNHPFFVGVVFRPEFSVKADDPSRLIERFISSMLNK